MGKPPKDRKDEIEDEAGAQERFIRGIGKALNTPPKPFTPKKKAKKEKGRKAR
jgi:hypothetical protein